MAWARYGLTRGGGLSGMNMDAIKQITDENERRFGTELSQNVVNNPQNQDRNNRKRTFDELNGEQKEEEREAPQMKRFRYNLRSKSVTMESTEVLGKENQRKNMNIDSDESDEDIDLMSHKNKKNTMNGGAAKPKRRKKEKTKTPLRRSARLKNMRLRKLREEIVSQKRATEPIYIEQKAYSEHDAVKANDDSYVIDYVEDIVNWYRECEDSISFSKNGYISSSFQTDLNDSMRYILLNWLLNVHRRFKLSDRTLFLGIYILDAYLSLVRIKRDELQLIGCASMWIASKYHEIYAPEANDFAYISAYSFNVDALFKAEIKILVALKFKFANMMTPLHFIQRYLQIASYPIHKKYEARGTLKALNDADKYIDLLQHLTCYFIELSLFDCKLVSTQKPSLIAAAAICFAILSISLYQQWPEFLRKETKYSYNDLKPILKRLNELRILSNTQLTSVRKKHPSITKWLDRLNISAAINNENCN